MAIHVAVGSKGNVHIQSSDPLTWPIPNPNILGNSHDSTYWCGLIQVCVSLATIPLSPPFSLLLGLHAHRVLLAWLGPLQYQLQPIVKKIMEIDPTMELVSPTLEELGGNSTGEY